MSADIEHVNGPIIIIQLDHVEDIAPDFIAGLEKPGNVCPVNNFGIMRKETFLDVGCRIQILLNPFLLPQQIAIELFQLFLGFGIFKYQLLQKLIVDFMIFDLGPGFQWFALSMVVGGAAGFLLHLLTRVRCSDEELLIFVLGMAVFSGGIALSLKLSPLFVNTLMGLVVANLPGSRNRIFHLLERLEKPFYIVFLILAGAIWHPAPPWGLPLAILYLGLRLIGKVSGGFLAARIAPESSRPPLTLGLGLISQGGIAIAMVMNYYQLSSAPVTNAVVTTVLLAVILNELASPYLARAVLHRAGEIERWPA